LHRTRGVITTPGGKGLNVARDARALGEKVTATGFAGGHNGRYIIDCLERLGLRHDFVPIAGESRICLNILDDRNGNPVSTEILEEGPEVSEEELEAMMRKISRLAAESSVMVFSGSLPKGAPDDTYARMTGLCAASGTTVCLDTSGAALREGIRGRPAFVKPNEKEITELIGRPAATREEIAAAIGRLMDEGIRAVAVTLGAAGCLAGHEGRLYEAAAPPVTAVNTVGCGDAFTAGMAVAKARGEPFDRCLAFAVAAASAAAMTARTGEVIPEDVRRLLPLVKIKELQV